MITRLHHAAIVTSNINDTLNFYLDFLRCEAPQIIQVDVPGLKLRTALLKIGPIGESLLQLIEPSEGPELDVLERRGEGAMLHLAFEVDNIEKFYDRMTGDGLTPVDITGQPFNGKYIDSAYGIKYFYLPNTQTRGTRIEIVQIEEIQD